MGYLVCEKCGGYYELKKGEAINDFQSCDCGGKLKYVKNLDEFNSESDKLKKMSKCHFCGAENLNDDKFCGNCGKPLNTTSTQGIPIKSKTKSNDGLSKYRNELNYFSICMGILGIPFFVFLILWLPQVYLLSIISLFMIILIIFIIQILLRVI